MNRDIRISEYWLAGSRPEAVIRANEMLQELESEQNRRVISVSVDWSQHPTGGTTGVLSVFVTHCDVLDA